MDLQRKFKLSKKNIICDYFSSSLDFQDIVNWTNPAVTVTVLVLLNVVYLIYRSVGSSIVSSAAHKLFLFTIVTIIRQHLLGNNRE